jgi:transposase
MKPHDARTLSPAALFDLRTRVVAAVRAGMSQSEAARVFAVHRSAVNRWCQVADPEQLRPRRRGRKPAGGPLDPGQTAELLDAIRTRHPDDLGLVDALWTRDAVAEYAARRFGVRRSRWVWGRWLRRHNFTPQRPARKAYQQDTDDLTRWRAEVYPAIAAEAKRRRAEIHWLDEAGVRTDHNPGTGYGPRGATPTARVNGRPARVNTVSALTNAGRVRFSVFAGRFTAAVLIGFLGRLLRGAPGAVFLVLDGHPVHRSRKVAAWVASQGGRLRLLFLPPYCPELNPTEYLNNAVKGGVPRFRRPRDRVELAERVRLWLRVIQRRPHLARRFFEAEPVRYAADPLSLLSPSG